MAGLSCVVLERRSRAGIKLLMCANNRCNFGHLGSAEELLAAYGEPVASFLAPAVRAMPSTAVARWFERMGLPVKRNGQRLYPASERGDDVLHLFLDILRERQVPVIYNCPVTEVQRIEGGFRVSSANLQLESKRLLLAVGGCSYPKTGSMGDGMLFAERLGLKTEAPRAGLVGVECRQDDALNLGRGELELPEVTATADGAPAVPGNLVLEEGILRGSAVYDLTRYLARRNLPLKNMKIDFLPGKPQDGLAKRWEMLCQRHGDNDALKLNGMGLPPRLAQSLAQYRDFPVSALKAYPVLDARTRPLREAIVTVGGIALEEFDPKTMQCKKIPGLYAAGECLDVDGPTGGYNLEAAFATAALAIRAIVG